MKSSIAIALCLSVISLSLGSCREQLQRSPTAATPSPETSSAAQPKTDRPAPPSTAPESTPTAPLPTVDEAGNYLRTSHRHWLVVDPDPQGLNCRWSNEIPDEWYSPAASYPRMTVSEWPVVERFPIHTKLQANLAPAGFAILYDENENPWLKVNLDNADEICLVRAHAAYLQPVPSPVNSRHSRS